MGKNCELKERVLNESETEKKLKAYLLKMSTFMGEEFTVATLSTNYDIVESLNEFTSMFENDNSMEIAFILIRSSLLSNKNNYFNDVIKNKLAFGEYQDILDLVNYNLAFRKNLTRTLINQSKSTDKELFSNLTNNNNILKDLDNLRFYEHIKNEKINEAKLILKSK